MSRFLRLLDVPVDDKAAALKAAAVFECDPEAFAAVPGSPFAYWVTESVRSLFRKHTPFEALGRSAASGGKTLDDFRWIRTIWEIGGYRSHEWLGFAKGGAFSPFYADVYLLLDWRADARGLKEYLVTYRSSRGWSPNWTAELHGSEHYFRPGLTWPRRTQSGFGIRALPAGCIFADKGPAAFVADDDSQDLLALLAITTSTVFAYLVELQMAFGSYEVGVIQRTPVPPLTTDDGRPTTQAQTLATLARRAWSLKRSLDTTTETSHAFVLPPGLNERMTGLDPAAIERGLAGLQREIDDLAFACYGIDGEERQRIEIGVGASASGVQGSGAEAQQSQTEPRTSNPEPLLSWLIGAAFARFDPRLATGERPIPPEPEPFDPLPARSPGMYPDGEEPADRPDILVDDEGHARDLAARARAVAERVQVDVPEDLRAWLAKDFFPLHIKMYSKSRRKAPIYWQLATPSASYSVWLYIHAFSKDTLFRVQNDYVAPKLAHEERRLEALTLEQRDGATATERKALAEQQALVEELRAFLAEVKRVAPLWNPNLDDGVIINFSLLWRLVPQHKPWQKELKKTWDALCEGKYDWAHLAMHLWPERVVPKCATDRSLAIAHDLESAFWEEDDDGKWRERVQGAGFRVQEVIDRLIAERTSAAVKAALQSLLDAPPPATGRGGGRRASGRGLARRPRSTTGRQRSGAPAAPDPAVMGSIKQAIEAAGDGASKADVLAATGLSDAQWTSAIAALLADGSVTKSGAGRGTRYHLLNPEP